MNLIVRRILLRTAEMVQIFNKQQYQTSVRFSKFPITQDSSIKNERTITRLMQENIILLSELCPKACILDKPFVNIIQKSDLNIFEVDIKPRKEILEPNTSVEKKANRMLIIKRKKMNRHKHKKFERKYRYQKMRIKRKRIARKETAFRNEIAGKLKELEKFDPAEYVQSKLERYRVKVMPNRIRGGVRMPPAIITEELEKLKQRKQAKLDLLERRKKFIEERGSILIAEAKKIDEA